ncbi:hypothetical protein RHSIM_RhsimUnG0157600 [Rhododendron simsii]|uniref:RIN4 pathogenic type III effector avirulence factor Avr cleavage site domain-containing protein n=1 Tax=Rhododendron simsii TaxID=118357 RepID=A0A834FUV8_RHOSS|nr:hypothetical protein RHSIM_RhsimUnG0157600 [Rhododendron simsii]
MHFSGDFETARKDRATVVGMNPNGQQENPEAFMFGRVGPGSGVHVDSDKLEVVEKRPTEGLGKDNSSCRSMVSASGNDKSSPHNSLQQRNPRRLRSDRKKSLTEINNFATSSPGSGMLISASNASDDKETSNINRSASVPKFGAWDEMDPNEGYTVIFNKVKEEKQTAATKFTAAPPKPSNSVNNQIKPPRSKVRIQRYYLALAMAFLFSIMTLMAKHNPNALSSVSFVSPVSRLPIKARHWNIDSREPCISCWIGNCCGYDN